MALGQSDGRFGSCDRCVQGGAPNEPCRSAGRSRENRSNPGVDDFYHSVGSTRTSGSLGSPVVSYIRVRDQTLACYFAEE